MKDAPMFYVKNRREWRAWLTKNHDKLSSVWLVFDKGKNRQIQWSDIVDEALCFGWVDGRAGTVSDTQSKIYVSRRKPKSTWSKINKAKVDQLIGAGLMQPAGLAAIEVGKANGAWDQLNLSDDLILPQELITLLDKNRVAKTNFEAFPPSSKKNILAWIYDAKTDTTRHNRIQQTLEMAAQNLRPR